MAKTAVKEINRDSEPLFTGTHKGGGATYLYDSNGEIIYDSEGSPLFTGSGVSKLYDKGANFRALGVDPDLELYAENETQGTSGTVTAADENTVTVSGVTWIYGDVYSIYRTSQKNQFISKNWVDVSRGWRINNPNEIDRYGWRNEDVDEDDRGRENVFDPLDPYG